MYYNIEPCANRKIMTQLAVSPDHHYRFEAIDLDYPSGVDRLVLSVIHAAGHSVDIRAMVVGELQWRAR